MSAIERIRSERVVAVLRRARQPERAAADLVAAGIGVVELTLDSDGALAAIARLRERGDVTVLAGTVRTAADVERAAAAGAEACVGPALVPAMVERCRELGIPAIPGALTPTEVEAAWNAGAALVKLFPAAAVGPGYVRALTAPLSDVPLLVTGGVDAGNAAAFVEAGAVAVGASLRARAEAVSLLAAVRSAGTGARSQVGGP